MRQEFRIRRPVEEPQAETIAKVPDREEIDALRKIQSQLESEVRAAAIDDEMLDAEIDSLLSENPEEFVLRFIQTIGQ
jgi:hypothetical protein